MNKNNLNFLNSSFNIGGLILPNRLIQGPLAGFSCAPLRQLFYAYTPPAYCVSEMISAHDIVHKHTSASRFIYRAPEEKRLCYQLSGNCPQILAAAAVRMQFLGGDLIDLNCGCPKGKIRKKGAGSALLEDIENLSAIVRAVRDVITIPLTVKIRLLDDARDVILAQAIEDAGADALIVHGRRWIDNYDIPCSHTQIANIKHAVTIPVIANGDIKDNASLERMMIETGCDGYMIARGGCGNPWIYQQILKAPLDITLDDKFRCFMTHLEGLASLESAHKAVLQSKSLVRYYFKNLLSTLQLQQFYKYDSLEAIGNWWLAPPIIAL